MSEVKHDLRAGEECVVGSDGTVRLRLVAGVLFFAGEMMNPNEVYTIPLKQEARSLTIYTLEGGAFSVVGEEKVTVSKYTTGAATVSQFVSRTVAPLKYCKVLVLGDSKGGKTVTAHTLFNLICQNNQDDIVPPRVTLLDFNTETNCLFTPGCVSAMTTSSYINPELNNLRLGETNSPTKLTLNFFTGSARRPRPDNAVSLLHYCQQLAESTEAFAAELHPNNEGRRYTVVDAPTPEEGLQEGTFYKRLIEILKPTHVVLVTSLQASEDSSGPWGSYLQEDVQRTLPDCSFITVTPLPPRTAGALSPRLLLQQEYFIGNALMALGVSKVVLSYSSIQFCRLKAGSSGTVSTEKCQPTSAWKGLLCFLSHAVVEEEVPLAPVAGQMLVVDVDSENQELILIIPAPENPLECRYIIVPNEEEWSNFRLSDAQMSCIEEAVSV